jgi:hypothetical protein
MITANSGLTQERLKELLSYDPGTGVFHWIARNGAAAGSYTIRGNKKEYLRISIDGKRYQAHRLAWLYAYGEWPKDQIDHINQNGIDNSIANLREVTSKENYKNRPIPKDNKSGHIGIYWHSSMEKWAANIGINGDQISLGFFKSKVDAIIVRKMAEYEHGFHENHGVSYKYQPSTNTGEEK